MTVGISRTMFPGFPDGTGRLRDPWFFAREAERLGFESIWAGEHLVIPATHSSVNQYHGSEVPAMPSSIVRLAGVAAATSQIRIGTAILLLPERNPLLLAKELATLDADSGGRLRVGVGMGWNRDEMNVLGGDFERRAAQTREAVEVLKALWTEEFVEHHGEFYDFPPVKSSPAPVQRPHPPILLGMHSAKALPRVVEYGDGWIESVIDAEALRGEGIEHIARSCVRLDELCREAGRVRSEIDVSVMLIDTEDAAVDRHLIAQYLDAGADRIILLGSLSHDTRFATDQEALDWLERTAERVIG